MTIGNNTNPFFEILNFYSDTEIFKYTKISMIRYHETIIIIVIFETDTVCLKIELRKIKIM